jgi:tetratricopeptide (TPR) repeat protein
LRARPNDARLSISREEDRVGTRIIATIAACALLTVGVVRPVQAEGDPAPTFRRIDAAAEAYLHYSLGRLMEVRGLLRDALVQFRRAESHDPGHCEIQVAIGRVLLAMGETGNARSAMEEALSLCPDELQALSIYATASMMLGEPGEASRVLGEAARRPDAPEELVVLLAQALVSDGRIDEANELYRVRALGDSLSPRIAYLHAQALLSVDRVDEAIEELARARRLDPENRAVQASLGRLLVASGRSADGVQLLEELLSGSHGLEGEYVALARGYANLDEPGRAIEAVESAIGLLGETPSLLGALGAARFQAGDVDGALDAYERVLEVEPDSVRALNFIAYTLADEDIDPARALGYAERAVELDPENGFVRDTLGWTYYKLGRLDEAREALEAAIELGGTDSVIFEHLGDTLLALGLIDEAVTAWGRALEIEPDRESAIERIESARGHAAPGASP